jgi:hypothetical protein
MSDDAFERVLHQSLYRFDCPDAHRLGDYELDMLDPAERTSIAAHVLECNECTAELAVLRTFLATPTRVPEPLLDRARRIVATLLTAPPQLAYGGLRGADDGSMAVYQADTLTVTLGPGSARGSMLGLVVAGDTPPPDLEAREVRLLPAEGSPVVSWLDDLGNFEFTNLSQGTYGLEIDLPDGVLVIQAVRVN